MNTLKNLKIGLICLLANAAFAQVNESVETEKKEAFSYMANAVEQLGFKNAPEAMAVTNGGTFSSAFLGVEFLYGNTLETIKKRVITLQDGHLPIMGFNVSKSGITYTLEAFSAPLGMNPKNDLVTYIKWTVTNTTDQDKTTKLGVGFQPILNASYTKEFIKHNTYCTPWYQDKYLDLETYKNAQDNFNFSNGTAFQANHMVLQYPNVFSEKDNKLSTSIHLKVGESKAFIFKMPFVPISNTHIAEINQIEKNSYSEIKQDVETFWKKEIEALSVFSVPEQKVMDTYITSYLNLLQARDILEHGEGFIQKCNEFQYDYFYVRDNAYFARMYDMLGLHKDSRTILEPYFVYDIEGKDLHFRQRTGIYNKFCYDYWGQILWALGSYYRQTNDKALLERTYKLLGNHMQDFKSQVGLDDRGLWPKTWPYDNEHIDGHYTGHNFWVILGLRYAILMAKEMGEEKDVEEWTQLYNHFNQNFKTELKKLTDITGGYIPPGMDKVEDGYDWANASAGLYPFEAIDKNDPIVKTTLETVRTYNYMEGVATYSGCNAYVAKDSILNGKELPERGLHHYETFYVTNGNLIIGNQKAVIEDMYAVLVHTSSTHAGFEWRPSPWGNRDPGNNRQPHGWMGARYIELLRNMLVREEGNNVHLLSAISPEWIKNGESITVNQAPTYFGDVSYKLTTQKNSFTIHIDTNWNDKLEQFYLHLPWFIKPTSVLVDNKKVNVSNGIINLPKNAKHVKVSWKNEIPKNLNYSTAVAIYLDKYYNHPPQANYAHLFPTSVAPGFNVDKTSNAISLFSLDAYGTVYFTTDGSKPTEKSEIYKTPIPLQNIKIIKAITIDDEGKKSDTKIINIEDLTEK